MGKGQKKRAQGGGFDTITSLERQVKDLQENIVYLQENHKKELADIQERWKQSKHAHKKNNSIDEAKKKIQECEETIQELRVLIKKGQSDIVKRDKRIVGLEDILETTRTKHLRDQQLHLQEIKALQDSKTRIIVEQENTEKKYMELRAVSDKKRREMVREEQEKLIYRIEEEYKEKNKIRFQEEFERLNEKELKKHRMEQERRRNKVDKRNEEYAILTAKHEKSIVENEEIRSTLEKEKEVNAKLYNECERMRMEQKRLICDIESMKGEYIETEESVRMKKEELEIIGDIESMKGNIENMKGEYMETEESVKMKKDELETIQKGTKEAVEEYRIKNGEIKVLYYTLDDSEQERFYDDDIHEEIKKVELGEAEFYETPKIGRWTYKIGLIAGVLMQINTHTKKTRPVLQKKINMSELIIPNIWTQQSEKIKLE